MLNSRILILPLIAMMLFCACSIDQSSTDDAFVTEPTTAQSTPTTKEDTSDPSYILNDDNFYGISFGESADYLREILCFDDPYYKQTIPEEITQKVIERVEFSDPQNPYLQFPEDYPEEYKRYNYPGVSLYYKDSISDGYLLMCDQTIAMTQAGGLLEVFVVSDENAEWIKLEMTGEAREMLAFWSGKVEIDDRNFYFYRDSEEPLYRKIMIIDRKTGDYTIVFPYA